MATISSRPREEPDARAQCTPCRGTGRVISGLGGAPHQVTCPWCGGTGRFHPGRDAQQSPATRSGDAA
jgi:DnaJ-class molecular chaperone